MKTKSFLLSSVLLAMPFAVKAQFTYTTNSGTITITGYGGSNYDVVIPRWIDGMAVTSIGDNAFADWWYMTSVTIPDSVTSIGAEAFVGSSIAALEIPNSVTRIGELAFYGSSLAYILIPDSVTNIEGGAFGGCQNLQAIDASVNNDMFISIDGVLFDKTQKTLIQFPAGNGAGSYTVPDGVTTILGEAFSGCSTLVNVAFPNTLTSIGDRAFSGVPLGEITIPSSVTSIGDGTFNGGRFSTISVPSSVTNIGVQAFFAVDFRSINVDPVNAFYSSLDGALFDKNRTKLIQMPNAAGFGIYTIPNTVMSIEDWAFYACWSLTNVIIPTSVTNIGAEAFSNCRNLKSVVIPDSVAHIGADAFLFTSLTEITIPNSITTIENDTFAATELTRVTIPSGVTQIGAGAFTDCPLTNVMLPNNLMSIGDVAFSWTRLSTIIIPSRVSSIGVGAFVYCSNLTSVYFQGNAPLTDLTGPEFEFPATAYYLPGTTGWAKNYGGVPTEAWTLPYPLILKNTPGFGVQTNDFGFTVSWATNVTVVIEASTDLSNPNWTPVTTNALHNGVVNFTDLEWTNYPNRFYRVRTQ